ncbi:MAG: hypothetical protein RL311_823 [Bacteroidota bacterium]|jgi:hypothetical protein
MKKANKLYYWLKRLGANVVNLYFESIVKKLNNPYMIVSSLKNRPQEIKEKHNYKFN